VYKQQQEQQKQQQEAENPFLDPPFPPFSRIKILRVVGKNAILFYLCTHTCKEQTYSKNTLSQYVW
jgi:hypothetical protein